MRTPNISSKTVVVHRKKIMTPHHCESLSPVVYLVQMQVPLVPNSTQRRQPFLIDHLPLAVFSTPLNFKICPSPQSRYSVLSDLPHHPPSLESLDSKRGVVLQFFLFCLVYLCLFIIFRSESWCCCFDSLLFDHCHIGVVYIVDSFVDYSLASL